MTWNESAPGKWNSDMGYSVRFEADTGTWSAFRPDRALSGGYASREEAQAACLTDLHE